MENNNVNSSGESNRNAQEQTSLIAQNNEAGQQAYTNVSNEVGSEKSGNWLHNASNGVAEDYVDKNRIKQPFAESTDENGGNGFKESGGNGGEENESKEGAGFKNQNGNTKESAVSGFEESGGSGFKESGGNGGEQGGNKGKQKSVYQLLNSSLSGNTDFVCEEINIGEFVVCYAFIDNLINKALVNPGVLEPLKKMEQANSLQDCLNKITVGGASIETVPEDLMFNLLSGCVLVFEKNGTEAISCPCQGFEKRAVQEPPTSAVLKGPREGFVEDLSTNISLIRRKIKSEDLRVEEVKIGKYTNSKVCVVYINSVADMGNVKEIKKKLKKINIDGVLDTFYIQSHLEPKHSLLFKQIGNTEKPEIAVAKLLEGRIVIIADGTPMVLTLPYTLMEDFQSPDDYYEHPLRASFVRMLRLFGFVIAITLPGIYVALQSFHFALLPMEFLISIQSSIQDLAFSPLLEILIVLFLFEILNEVSVRMPKYLGMAISIIGALVLGDTAVQAGIISSPSVIMVAISGITLYMVPNQTATASILRLFFTVIGGVAGFYGMLLGFVGLTAYLMTFDAFGSPYFAPYAPRIPQDKKDGLFKVKQNKMYTRPISVPNTNPTRQTKSKGGEE